MPARSKVGSRKRTAPRRAVKAASGPHAASASRKTRGTSKKKTAKPSPAAGRKTGKPSPAAGPRARAGREAPWRQEFQRFRREWRRTHPPRPGKRHEMARTFLKVTRTADTASAFSGLGLKHVPVIVQNLGNVAAYTCVVRMLEARPRSPIHEKIPLGEFTLGGSSSSRCSRGSARRCASRSCERAPTARSSPSSAIRCSTPTSSPSPTSIIDGSFSPT